MATGDKLGTQTAADRINNLVNGSHTGDARSGSPLAYLLRSGSPTERILGMERVGAIAGLLRKIEKDDSERATFLSKWVSDKLK